MLGALYGLVISSSSLSSSVSAAGVNVFVMYGNGKTVYSGIKNCNIRGTFTITELSLEIFSNLCGFITRFISNLQIIWQALSCVILFHHNSVTIVGIQIFWQNIDLSQTFCTLFSSLLRSFIFQHMWKFDTELTFSLTPITESPKQNCYTQVALSGNQNL
jgi:hypothetical protein